MKRLEQLAGRVCWALVLGWSLFGNLSPIWGQKLSGTIQNESGAPLMGVRIQLHQPATAGAFSGFDGAFSLNLPSEEATPADSLYVSFLGFEPQVLSVAEALQSESILIVLKPVQVDLAGISIEADRTVSEEFSVQKLGRLDIYSIPNSAGDPLRAITMLPASSNLEETATPVLRGSGPGRNRVLLNEVPIANPVKNSEITGVGYFSIFSTELVERMDIYASNPPLIRSNSVGGLVDIQTTAGLSRPGTQLTLGLATVGFLTSQPIQKQSESFVQLYGNYQFAQGFLGLNRNALPFIRDFGTQDIGLNVRYQLGKHAHVNLIGYGLREHSDIEVGILGNFQPSVSSNLRSFQIVNYRYYKNRFALSLNSGTNFSQPTFEYGNLRTSFKEQNSFQSAFATFYPTDRITVKGGFSYEYLAYQYENQLPAIYFAFSDTAPSFSFEQAIHDHRLEGVAYLKWQMADSWWMGAGLRQRIPLAEGTSPQSSGQLNLRHQLSPDHSLQFSVGTYEGGLVPNGNIQEFVEIGSQQVALEYQGSWGSGFQLQGALFGKREDGLIDFRQQTVGEQEILGAEIAVNWQVLRNLRIFGSYQGMKKTIIDESGTYPAWDQVPYFLKAGLQWLPSGWGTIDVSYLTRPGTRYTPVVGGNFVEDLQLFEPLFASEFNQSQLSEYHNLSLSYNRFFSLGNTRRLMVFLTMSNLTNAPNERGVFYSPDYAQEIISRFGGRTVYIGSILSW